MMKKLLPYIINSGILLIAFGLYSVLQSIYILPKNMTDRSFAISAAWILLVTVLMIGAMWWVYKFELKQDNPFRFDEKPHFRGKNIVITVVGFFALIAFQIAVSPLMGNQQPENEQTLNQIVTQVNPLFKLLIVFVGPVVEELIFRGFLFNIILKQDKRWAKILAVILGGLLFGLMHEPSFSVYLIVYWGMGIILSGVYVWTKDLRYSIVVHILNNSLSML